METIFSGKSATFHVAFMTEGNYATPDVGSIVTYSLFGNDGAPVAGYDNAVVPQPENGVWSDMVNLTISAEANTPAVGNKKESRTIVVFFVSEGRHLSVRRSYRLCGFLPYDTSKEDVRAVFGLSDTDIADEQIDLDGAYCEFIEEYPAIEPMFVGNGRNRTLANRGLALSCAISFANGLALLSVGSESDGNSKIARFEKGLDFAGMVANAKSELTGIIGELGVGQPSDDLAVNMFNVVTTEDIFTGE